MPKISVIIPVYNRQDIVAHTVQSVLNQTDRDLEVLVVDDGSTDDTRAVIQNLADSRVNYFYKANDGPASARNFGLSKARGEYIAFLDSDDLWPENYLQVILANLENCPGFSAAYTPITVFYPDGTKISSYTKSDGKSGKLGPELFKHSFIWIFAAVFCRSIWNGFYFDEQLKKICEDSDVLLRLSMQTRFLFVPQVQAFHRISNDSISSSTEVDCMRLLVLERFYFHLGGDKIVPLKAARRRLSHTARKIAEFSRRKGSKMAALKLYRHAVRYWPYDVRLYWGLLKTWFLNSAEDAEPNWAMPQPLGNPVGTNRFD